MRVSKHSQLAFTLVELMIALAVLAALAAIALPNYEAYIERARIAQAIKDVGVISVAIDRYYTRNNAYPLSLAAIGANKLDPWKHPYQYLAIDTVPAPSKGKLRKDKNDNPLNNDYDLYSMGPDGETSLPLTASKAQDDIVRAGNGGFIGVAKDF